MTDVKTIEGDFGGTGRKFAIVAGRFNGYIVDSLVARRDRYAGASWRQRQRHHADQSAGLLRAAAGGEARRAKARRNTMRSSRSAR